MDLELECHTVVSHNRKMSTIQFELPADGTRVTPTQTLMNREVVRRHLDTSKVLKTIQQYHFELYGQRQSQPGYQITFSMPMAWDTPYDVRMVGVSMVLNAHDGAFLLHMTVQNRSRAKKMHQTRHFISVMEPVVLKNFVEWIHTRSLLLLASACEQAVPMIEAEPVDL